MNPPAWTVRKPPSPLAGYPCTNLDHGFDGSVRDENGECSKCGPSRPPRRCLHGVWTYGKSLTATVCLDFRECVACGGTEYKQQWEKWSQRP